jgi:hypothetical protein
MNMSVAGLSAAAILLGSLAVAHAEPADADAAYRSPATASLLSIGGFAASGLTMMAGLALDGGPGGGLIVIGAASLLITPSIGQFYSGNYLSAGLLTRLAGTAAMALGGYLVIRSFDFDVHDDDSGEAAGSLLFAGGGIAFLTGAIIDVTFAGTAAERWNAKHGITVAPTAIATPSGTTAALGLSGRF